MSEEESDRDILLRIARELKTIREGVGKGLFAMGEAETEVPEMMRRFANYFHDLVHIMDCYKTLGILVPPHLNEEIQRCDDRMRQLLNRLHTDGGAFEKVRADMAKDPENRWDHTRLLTTGKASE